MTGTVTVYFNTGFNGIDIPSSASVLANASQSTYSDVYYMREDIDKPSIRIKDSYENLCAVDYCAITTNGTTKYYFASPSALSKGVTLLTLDLDGLLTMGGAENIDYISGWQERGHIKKTDDTLFSNVASEEWVPSQPLEAANSQGLRLVSGGATKDWDIIISNIALYDLGSTPLTQEAISGQVSGQTVMYFPSIHVVDPTNETPFSIWDFSQSSYHQFHLPNTAGFDASNTTVRQGLQKLFSCGQLQLQGSYKIPQMYLQSDPQVGTGTNVGRLGEVKGIHDDVQLSAIPFEYSVSGYTVKNKKVFSTFRNYVIVNTGSGDMSSKEPAEIFDGNSYPTIDVWADPCSTGKPYARFSYIKGNPIQYSDCVRGLQWANSQLVMEGASGSLWNSIDNAFANQQIQRSQAMNSYNSAIATAQNLLTGTNIENSYAAGYIDRFMSGVTKFSGSLLRGNISGAGLSVIGTGVGNAAALADKNNALESLRLSEEQQKNQAAFNELQYQQQINQNSIGLIKSNNVVAPSVSFTPEQNLGLYDYNQFVIYEVRKSDEDLKSEDMYYQRYGYNGLHRPLTQQCFKERQYYNYVQAFDINLKSSSQFGMRVRMKAISQLNKGVRVWRVLPDASYYETN